MSNTVAVYCRHFISTNFKLSNGKIVTVHGTNKHELDLPAGTPYCNHIDYTDWQNVLAEYQETNRAPHLFGDSRHEALIFEAENDDVAMDVASDAPDVIPDKYAQSNDVNLKAAPKRSRAK